MVHRKVLERLNGHLWNSGYLNGFSDLEMFLNIKREGFNVWLFPQYRIVHYGSYLAKRYPRWIERDQARGFVLYFRYWKKAGTPHIRTWLSPSLCAILFGLEGIGAIMIDLVGRVITKNPFFVPRLSAWKAGERILGIIEGWRYRIKA